tara:strand:- start:1851 stop:2711 length:861 start_codon:yes stop_codon:yes gene_type:complete
MLKLGTFTGFSTQLHNKGILEIHFSQAGEWNTTTTAMKRDLIETLLQAQMDNRVRVAMFTADGPAFIAGDNMKGYTSTEPSEGSPMQPVYGGHDNAIGTYEGLRNISQALNAAVRNLDKLTVCAINGYAIQTGFTLALCCDFRIASTDAKMGSATLRYALLPDEGGHYMIVQFLGVAKAMEFLMRKRIVTAQEALELGLVHQVVEPAKLRNAAMELAEELTEGPQVAMRLLKRSVYNAPAQTFEQACDDIAAKTGIVDYHPDSCEGVQAFKEKRKPAFNAWLGNQE